MHRISEPVDPIAWQAAPWVIRSLPATDARKGPSPIRGRVWWGIWSGGMRRVVFGILVGAVVCALAIRLALDVTRITALDAEDGASVVMRIRRRPPALQQSRTPPPASRQPGADPGN